MAYQTGFENSTGNTNYNSTKQVREASFAIAEGIFVRRTKQFCQYNEFLHFEDPVRLLLFILTARNFFPVRMLQHNLIKMMEKL